MMDLLKEQGKSTHIQCIVSSEEIKKPESLPFSKELGGSPFSINYVNDSGRYM